MLAIVVAGKEVFLHYHTLHCISINSLIYRGDGMRFASALFSSAITKLDMQTHGIIRYSSILVVYRAYGGGN